MANLDMSGGILMVFLLYD